MKIKSKTADVTEAIDFLSRLKDDQTTAEILGIEPGTISAKRCRGTWPFKTYKKGRQPLTDVVEVAEHLKTQCIPPNAA